MQESEFYEQYFVQAGKLYCLVKFGAMKHDDPRYLVSACVAVFVVTNKGKVRANMLGKCWILRFKYPELSFLKFSRLRCIEGAAMFAIWLPLLWQKKFWKAFVACCGGRSHFWVADNDAWRQKLAIISCKFLILARNSVCIYMVKLQENMA